MRCAGPIPCHRDLYYEITAAIGAGGMGEVYRARDSKLGRDVAVKVQPEEFARDAERMARFRREAKILASLNHSNIAAIHGLEDSGSTHERGIRFPHTGHPGANLMLVAGRRVLRTFIQQQ